MKCSPFIYQASHITIQFYQVGQAQLSLFLCFILATSYLFICTGLLIVLSDFLFVGMEISWTLRKWFLNINQLSWAHLPSRNLFHRTLLSRFLRRSISALLKSRVVILFFFFTSLTSSSLSPELHCLIVIAAKVARELPLTTPENSWFVYVLLHCPSSS